MTPFVTPQWLAERLDDPRIVAIDGSWHMPDAGRDADAEFREHHIPGATRFDIDAVADATSDLPHMLPDAQIFSAIVGPLGIGSDMSLVVYDSIGLFSAPRVWWSLVAMGASDVRILAGGLPAWRAAGLPVETGAPDRAPVRFVAQRDTGRIVGRETVSAAIGTDVQIVDARPAARFSGSAPEPRPGLRSGHIPTSRSMPAADLISDGTLLAPDALRKTLLAAGISLAAPTITTCGSGVTAATLALALEVAGAPPARVYDGSWCDWGREGGTPVETGAT